MSDVVYLRPLLGQTGSAKPDTSPAVRCVAADLIRDALDVTIAHLLVPDLQRLGADGVQDGQEARLVRVSEHVGRRAVTCCWTGCAAAAAAVAGLLFHARRATSRLLRVWACGVVMEKNALVVVFIASARGGRV